MEATHTGTHTHIYIYIYIYIHLLQRIFSTARVYVQMCFVELKIFKLRGRYKQLHLSLYLSLPALSALFLQTTYTEFSLRHSPPFVSTLPPSTKIHRILSAIILPAIVGNKNNMVAIFSAPCTPYTRCLHYDHHRLCVEACQ